MSHTIFFSSMSTVLAVDEHSYIN